MYSVFEDDSMHNWFYRKADIPSQTRYYTNGFDAYEALDDDWDRLLDPQARRLGPDNLPVREVANPQQNPPPPIGHVEVTTDTRSARERAYAQLMQHQLIGVAIPGRRDGRLNPPMSQRPASRNTGLAVVNTSTGAVTYTVFAPHPQMDRVLWRGHLGVLTPAERSIPQGRERGVRHLLRSFGNLTGQRNFRRHSVHAPGPDLVPMRTSPIPARTSPIPTQRIRRP